MNPNEVPTKGNLLQAKNSLKLANQGYELMDKKRNILIRELMMHIDEAKNIQSQIDSIFTEAYRCLQQANMEMGIQAIQIIAKTIPLDDSVSIKTRSIMGCEIPYVQSKPDAVGKPFYALYRTRDSLDETRQAFLKVKQLTIELSQVEITSYRLAANIQKTQKRANALKNITIPYYEQLVRTISNALEEKEREEFTRLKVIKNRNK